MAEETSEFEAAYRRGLEAREVIDVGGTPHLVVPNDAQLVALDHARDRPARTVHVFNAGTPDAFVEYVNRFAVMDETVVFFDTEHGTFRAIFDYDTVALPNWRDHSAALALKKTPEWLAWEKNDGEVFAQEKFAEFVEEHIDDIVEPSGAQMLEIARTLQADTSIKFKKGIRLENGNIDLQYTEEVDGRAGPNGTLTIPAEFSIGVALFEGTSPYRIRARFKYRIRDGNAALRYELVKPHRVREEVVRDVQDRMADMLELALPFYEGA